MIYKEMPSEILEMIEYLESIGFVEILGYYDTMELYAKEVKTTRIEPKLRFRILIDNKECSLKLVYNECHIINIVSVSSGFIIKNISLFIASIIHNLEMIESLILDNNTDCMCRSPSPLPNPCQNSFSFNFEGEILKVTFNDDVCSVSLEKNNE